MGFKITNANIAENQVVFIYEECAYPGVRTVAGWVRDDLRKVFGARPIGVEYAKFRDTADFYSYPIFFGTIGNSAILDKMAADGKLNLFEIAGESDAYSFSVIDDLEFEGFKFSSAIVIAGGGKRGTVYGLLKLSELLGVSPFVNWLDVMPQKKTEFILTCDASFVSTVPSVRFRGFSVNEGIHSDDRMIELLLRLKGNVLWTKEEVTAAEELGIITGESLLNDTTLLYDDNYGNLCKLPEDTSSGSFGMYYHLAYHGMPISYEWVNTNHLTKIWEQMTSAYDNGITDVWIADVGNLFTNEYPLAFFLDLAYDLSAWGTGNKNCAEEYTKEFVKKSLAGLSEEDRDDTVRLLLGYTKIASRRRTESMNESVYAPFAYHESENLLKETDELMSCSKRIYKSAGKELEYSFYELVHMPLTATLNVTKMWILTGLNHAYASIGSTYANTLAQGVNDCIKKDRKIISKLQKIHKGMWKGMCLSGHIGIVDPDEEVCRYPVVHTFEPADKKRLIVGISSSGDHAEPKRGQGSTLTMNDALDPLVCGGCIELSTASKESVSYYVVSDDEFIDIVDPQEKVECGQLRRIFIFVDRMKLPEGKSYAVGNVRVGSVDAFVDIRVPVWNPQITDNIEDNTFMVCAGEKGFVPVISIGASDYAEKHDTDVASFEIIKGLGIAKDAIKAYPQNMTFAPMTAPTVTYKFILPKAGKYAVRFYTSPSNPPAGDGKILFGIASGNGALTEVNMLPEGFKVGPDDRDWIKGIVDNVRILEGTMDFAEGLNLLCIGAISPGFVLEKIVIYPEDVDLPYSYLGPSETFFVKS